MFVFFLTILSRNRVQTEAYPVILVITFQVTTGNLQQWLLRRIAPSHRATEGYDDRLSMDTSYILVHMFD